MRTEQGLAKAQALVTELCDGDRHLLGREAISLLLAAPYVTAEQLDHMNAYGTAEVTHGSVSPRLYTTIDAFSGLEELIREYRELFAGTKINSVILQHFSPRIAFFAYALFDHLSVEEFYYLTDPWVDVMGAPERIEDEDIPAAIERLAEYL